MNLNSISSIKSLGLDFDNTIVDYGLAFSEICKLLNMKISLRNKEDIKNYFLEFENGDILWQEFQSKLYTMGLKYAQPSPGLISFLHYCQSKNIKVHIVSHKTIKTSKRFGGLNLRNPAIDWLKKFQITPCLINKEDIHFCETQEIKIDLINRLKIDLFVDDLPEIINHVELDSKIIKILFNKINANSGINFHELLVRFEK
jgi:hypothetical protein